MQTRRVDPLLALAGLGVGIVVGLTGMGGGALMTPLLVLLFNVPPLAAVSSDLAASAVMKPFGGWVHARRGTVNWQLVRWLCVGSVPSAFAGVLLLPGGGASRERAQAVRAARSGRLGRSRRHRDRCRRDPGDRGAGTGPSRRRWSRSTTRETTPDRQGFPPMQG